MTIGDLTVLLRDVILALTWYVAVVYFLSGCQDFLYDIGAYSIRLFRRLIWYKKRPRLTLERLRAREQQRIAVIVPAWNEGEVVGSMVDNILKRVEYRNYVVFVGVYPNDPATNNAVDRLSAIHPQIIKVVNTRPGPTTKADCLNNVYRTLKVYEEREGVNFDLIVMHDAEDVVHPHSFLLYNYLIPRVDAIQIPILPLPTKWTKWVHWVYADEFSENHMKDVPVREKVSGFVPFAGTGTGFSRRVFSLLEQRGHQVFNESSLTEDYSLSKKLREFGMTAIFVNVVLGNDKSKWWVPLSKRPEFIANWAYFPMDFTRSVRQKTRWILGISLQEWESGGWNGSTRIKENLIKDRKVFVAAGSSLVGYFVLIYFILYQMGQLGWVPFELMPVMLSHSTLQFLVSAASFFMIVRGLERVIFVSMTYGIGPGLMSLPRLMVGNVINGLAAFRALQAFSLARQGKAPVRWDTTTHLEGVGQLPTESKKVVSSDRTASVTELLDMLYDDDPKTVVSALNLLPRELWEEDRREVIRSVSKLALSEDSTIRSAVARAVGYLQWKELVPWHFRLVQDRDWLVRANAARALLKRSDRDVLLEQAFFEGDPYICEILVKSIEQDQLFQQQVFQFLHYPELKHTRAALMDSEMIRHNYEIYERMAGQARL